MIRGTAKFDGLALGEGSFNFLGPTTHLEAKAAFINSQTGDTHGWTKNIAWSPAVMEKLKELRALMEADLGRIHLSGGDFASPYSAPNRPDMGGLGEHLETTPQV